MEHKDIPQYCITPSRMIDHRQFIVNLSRNCIILPTSIGIRNYTLIYIIDCYLTIVISHFVGQVIVDSRRI